MTRRYVKRRGPAVPGSIPAALDMFRAEVRFHREVAPVVGVRAPACRRSYAPSGSAGASGWISRLATAAARLQGTPYWHQMQ